MADAVKILLIEDHPMDARMITDYLGECAEPTFEVWQAADLEDQAAIAAAIPCEIILLDLNLKTSSGKDTYHQAAARFPKSAIILLTGTIDEQLARDLVREGAQDYVSKRRANPEVLKRAISYALDRRQHLIASQVTENRYRMLFEHAVDAIFIVDLEGRYLDANPAACSLLGYSLPELLDIDIFITGPASAALAPKERARALEQQQAAWRLNPSKYSTLLRRKDSSLVPTDISAAPIDYQQQAAFLISARDISDYVEVSSRLIEERNRAQLYLDTASVILLALDAQGSATMINQEGCRLMGLAEEDVLGRSWIDCFVPRQERAAAWQLLGNHLASKTASVLLHENRVLAADGSEPLIAWRNVVIFDRHGEPSGFLCSGEDISARRQSEIALEQSEQRFRALAETATEAIISIEDQDQITFANPAVERIFGYRPDELLGKDLRALMSAESFKKHQSALQRYYHNGSPLPSGSLLELHAQRRNGETFPVELSLSTALVNDQRSITAVIRDISRRKNAETAILQRNADLGLINTVHEAVNRGDSLNQIIEIYTSGILETFGCSGAGVYLLDSSRHSLLRMGLGLPREIVAQVEKLIRNPLPSLEFPLDQEAPYSAPLAECRPMVYDGQQAVFALFDYFARGARLSRGLQSAVRLAYPALIELLRIKSMALVPLVAEGKAIGALELSLPFPAEALDLERIQTSARQLTATIRRLQTEDTLQNIQQQHSMILNAAGDGIFQLDLEGRITFINRTGARTLGYQPDELIGRDSHSTFHRHEAESGSSPAACKILQALEAAKPAFIARDRFSGKHGDEVFVAYTVSPVLQAGKPVGAVVVFRDISERLRTDRERLAILDLSQALRTATTRAEMLPTILDQVSESLGLRAAAITLIGGAQGRRQHAVEASRGLWELNQGAAFPVEEEISASVLESGHALVANESGLLSFSALLPDWLARAEINIACVPLIAQGTPLGTLWVGQTAAFTPTDEQVLNSIGSIASNAIHRASTHEHTTQRLAQLDALHSIDKAIASSMDLKLTMNILLGHVVAQLKVDAAVVRQLDPDSLSLETLAVHGLDSSQVAAERSSLASSLLGQVVVQRAPIHIPCASEYQDQPPLPAIMKTARFEAIFAVPLIAKGRVKGVLELYHQTPLFPEAEWLSFLDSLGGQAAIALDNAEMFEGLQRSNLNLTMAYDATIEGWSRALELRDRETEGHSQRVTEATLFLAGLMGIKQHEFAALRRGALLHDIGKMGIPDSILLKPGPLSDEEWEIMRRHPELAQGFIASIDYLRPSLDIPLYHHEQWAGGGYPFGLRGTAIPLSARIFALVDVWDALLSDRPYRAAWDEARVFTHLTELAGTHFDPQVTEVFLANRQALMQLRQGK